jgi:hypothetical protein
MTAIEQLLELKSRLEELSVLVKKIDSLVLELSSKKEKKEKKVKEEGLPEQKEKKPRKVKIVIPTEEVKDATV